MLVVGVTSNVGSAIVKKLLDDGQYRVKGTVRSKRSPKLDALKEAFLDKYDEIELVEADLLDSASLAAAAEGCDYVFHVASPFPKDAPKNESEVVRPAVDGTLAILEACVASGVKRIVVTSAMFTIYDVSMTGTTISESTFAKSDYAVDSNQKSKILAEEAAWDFIKNHRGDLEMNTIHPGLVLGPTLMNGTPFTSATFIGAVMDGKVSAYPDV